MFGGRQKIIECWKLKKKNWEKLRFGHKKNHRSAAVGGGRALGYNVLIEESYQSGQLTSVHLSYKPVLEII